MRLKVSPGKWWPFWLGLSGVETGMLLENQVNTMAHDALGPCIVKPSAIMMLNVSYQQALVIHMEGFQLFVVFFGNDRKYTFVSWDAI